MLDATTTYENCEDCARFNPKLPKELVVTPDYSVEDLMPMDEIGMDLMKYQGKVFLVIVDRATGYSWCKPLGKIVSSKEVAAITMKIFLKVGIPYRVRVDSAQEFRGPFKEMLEECKIPYTPCSPYNSPSNRLAERHVGITKLLLKKNINNKTDFQESLSHLKNSARPDGYSPVELFYRPWP